VNLASLLFCRGVRQDAEACRETRRVAEAHFYPASSPGHAGRASAPLPTTLITVPTPSPTSLAMRRMPNPLDRSANASFTFLAWLCSTVRRPSFFPSARARANPAITRSRIIALSNSANTPSIWNIARPGSGGIEPLLMQEQVNAFGMEVRQEAQQVRKGSTKPIHRPSSHHIDLTSSHSHHQLIKARTFVATLGP
jgi:hypothetical protein